MTHHPDTSSIEDGIAASRTRLAATLEELWDRASVDSVAHDALGLIRSNAADYTGALDRAVRANPLALAVTGIGLAWLVFGSRRTTPEPAPDTGARREADDGAARFGGRDEATGVTEDDNTWSQRLDALRDVATSALRGIERDARSCAASTRDYAAERASVLSAFTADMRDAMSDGLDGLSDAARDRIVKAREAAYAARLRVQEASVSGGREVGRFVNDHPLIAGGLAMALGAAFAAVLPRTRVEDRNFGAKSDRLMARASAVLSEERAHFAGMAGDVAGDLKVAARDAIASAGANAAKAAEKVSKKAQDA